MAGTLHLPLGDHMHQLDATQEKARAAKGFIPEHRSGDALDRPMVLHDDVVQVFDLALPEAHCAKPAPASLVSASKCREGAWQSQSLPERWDGDDQRMSEHHQIGWQR